VSERLFILCEIHGVLLCLRLPVRSGVDVHQPRTATGGYVEPGVPAFSAPLGAVPVLSAVMFILLAAWEAGQWSTMAGPYLALLPTVVVLPGAVDRRGRAERGGRPAGCRAGVAAAGPALARTGGFRRGAVGGSGAKPAGPARAAVEDADPQLRPARPGPSARTRLVTAHRHRALLAHRRRDPVLRRPPRAPGGHRHAGGARPAPANAAQGKRPPGSAAAA
jgi:hypothetical protein